VTVPRKVGGRIIGKFGAKIRQFESDLDVKIEVKDLNTEDSTVKVSLLSHDVMCICG
jgi:hypothetical protein